MLFSVVTGNMQVGPTVRKGGQNVKGQTDLTKIRLSVGRNQEPKLCFQESNREMSIPGFQPNYCT